jgi:hypothetical protein
MLKNSIEYYNWRKAVIGYTIIRVAAARVRMAMLGVYGLSNKGGVVGVGLRITCWYAMHGGIGAAGANRTESDDVCSSQPMHIGAGLLFPLCAFKAECNVRKSIITRPSESDGVRLSSDGKKI